MADAERVVQGYDGGGYRLGQELVIFTRGILKDYQGAERDRFLLRTDDLLNSVSNNLAVYGLDPEITIYISESLRKYDELEKLSLRVRLGSIFKDPKPSFQDLATEEGKRKYLPVELVFLTGYRLAKQAIDHPYYSLDEVPPHVTGFGSPGDYLTDKKTLEEEFPTWFLPEDPLG